MGQIHHRRVSALLVVAAIFVVLVGLAPASQAAVTVDELYDVSGPSFTVLGLGNGHGHGMSQYGARGAANAGLTASQIMNFYYPGTSMATAGPTAIRVGLSTNDGNDMWIADTATLTIHSLADGTAAPHPVVSGAAIELTASGGQTIVNQYYSGASHILATLNGGAEVVDSSGTPVALGVPVTSATPSGLKPYRGALRTVILSDGTRRALNWVVLDDYVQGVVPSEMPASWAAVAVQAQAIAARTYALFEARANSGSWSDICDTTYCQVYGGVNAEASASNAAVAATAGQYVSYGGAPAFTQFSSSNGGWTSAGSQPYLDHHADPYDPAFSWSLNTTTAALASLYPAGGRITQIGIVSREGGGQWNGRVLGMVLNGSAGQVTVSPFRFQAVLGLSSNWFTINAANLHGRPDLGPPPPPPPAPTQTSASVGPVVLAPVPTGTAVQPVAAASVPAGPVAAPPVAPVDAQPVSAAAAIAKVPPRTPVTARPPWVRAAVVAPTRCWSISAPYFGAVATMSVCSNASGAQPIRLGPIKLI